MTAGQIRSRREEGRRAPPSPSVPLGAAAHAVAACAALGACAYLIPEAVPADLDDARHGGSMTDGPPEFMLRSPSLIYSVCLVGGR